MLENLRRVKQGRNFTADVSKILDLKSSSAQISSKNWRWVPLYNGHLFTAATIFCPQGGHCGQVQLYLVQSVTGLCSCSSRSPLVPYFCFWVTKIVVFSWKILCWAPSISQVQRTRLPSIFHRTQACVWAVQLETIIRKYIPCNQVHSRFSH